VGHDSWASAHTVRKRVHLLPSLQRWFAVCYIFTSLLRMLNAFCFSCRNPSVGVASVDKKKKDGRLDAHVCLWLSGPLPTKHKVHSLFVCCNYVFLPYLSVRANIVKHPPSASISPTGQILSCSHMPHTWHFDVFTTVHQWWPLRMARKATHSMKTRQ